MKPTAEQLEVLDLFKQGQDISAKLGKVVKAEKPIEQRNTDLLITFDSGLQLRLGHYYYTTGRMNKSRTYYVSKRNEYLVAYATLQVTLSSWKVFVFRKKLIEVSTHKPRKSKRTQSIEKFVRKTTGLNLVYGDFDTVQLVKQP